jgi:hypothetical protein
MSQTPDVAGASEPSSSSTGRPGLSAPSTSAAAGGGIGAGGSVGSGSTSAPPDAEALAQRLQDDKVDLKAKLQVVVEVKEMLEMFHSVDYGKFLKAFVPAYTKQLDEVPCSFISTADEQVSSDSPGLSDAS